MNKLNKQLKNYRLLRIVKIPFTYIRTLLFYKPATFIFSPIDIRGKKYIRFGKGMTCGTGCRFEAYPVKESCVLIDIGENVQINDYVHLTAIKHIHIGNNVLMVSRIYISDTTHGNYSALANQSDPDSIAKERSLFSKKVLIDNNVWIGEGVCILPGVRIGRNSIIGANSVVTKAYRKTALPRVILYALSKNTMIKPENVSETCKVTASIHERIIRAVLQRLGTHRLSIERYSAGM